MSSNKYIYNQYAKKNHDIRMYLDNYTFPYCDEVQKYTVLSKVGEGTFGVVFKACEKRNINNIVALKKLLIRNENGSFPITAIREINILKHVKHDNIVNLLEICNGRPKYSSELTSNFYSV